MLAVAFGGLLVNAGGLWLLRGDHDHNLNMRGAWLHVMSDALGSIQAIVAAEVGSLDLAYEYFRETALVDLRDLSGNTVDGVHLASLAGAWLTAVAGFGGMRDHGGVLSFAPRLPPPITRLCFRLLYRGRTVRVTVVPGDATYELVAGDPLEFVQGDASIALRAGSPVTLAWDVPIAPPELVVPPPGREPLRRKRGLDDVV